MSAPQSQCWAFRVDSRYLAGLDGELQNGKLRQGWGWDSRQDLRAMEVDAGAGRNRPMFNRVKRGDRLLIPHLPRYGHITIAEATEDWNRGYNFSVWEKSGDHGDIFPARPLQNFRRGNPNVPAAVEGTFRNPSRFCNITYLQKDIEHVLSLPAENLQATIAVVDHWHQQIEDIVKESGLRERLFTAAQEYFSKSDWEYLLTDVLRRLNPGWKVKRTGGKAEVKHGTDILATIPDVFQRKYYSVAIRVKDYKGFVNDDPIHQILKARHFWPDFGIEILQLVIVLVGGDKQASHQLEESAMKAGVRLIWSTDVEELAFRSACGFISDPEPKYPPANHPRSNQGAFSGVESHSGPLQPISVSLSLCGEAL
jgi:hypothetical protein